MIQMLEFPENAFKLYIANIFSNGNNCFQLKKSYALMISY